MKNQALFSSKDKSKKLKCCLLQFLFGVLRVKYNILSVTNNFYHYFLILALFIFLLIMRIQCEI